MYGTVSALTTIDNSYESYKSWCQHHGKIEDSETLKHILSKYTSKNILVVDDINDSGKTLHGILSVIKDFDSKENNNMFSLHEGIKFATLFDKESSEFNEVEFTANVVLPDQERWIVFPYEEWWK